jgi:hypothetical protein
MSALLKLGKELHDLYEAHDDSPNARKYSLIPYNFPKIFTNKFFLSFRIAFTRLEGLYYINDETLTKLADIAKASGRDITGEFYEEKNSRELIHRLATQVYSNSDEKTTLKALLYHTYHHA